MKKRISLLLLVCLLTLSLFGCGSESKELSDYDVESMEYYSASLIESFYAMSDEDMNEFKDASDFELEYSLLMSGLPIGGEDFLVMIDSWQNAEKEYGEFVSYGDFTAEASDRGGVILTTEVQYETQEADLVFNFDEKENMTSMTVEIHYTMGQILTEAGLNTLLGMGTVFIVLIFIAFIISLFKYIPVIQGLFKKNAEPAKEPAKKKEKPAPTPKEKPVVHIMNDSELVAVIAAAIAAAEGTTPDGFIVRSIKRRKTNHWK